MTPENESPFVTIWEAPRATIRRIVDSDPRRHVNLLFFGGGVVGTLSALRSHAPSFDVPPLFAAGGCILVGLLSVPSSHLGAWYMRSIGGWLGGTASRQEVAAAFAWAGVPAVVGGFALWVLQFALFGTELLSPERPTIDAASPLLLTTLRLASLLLGVWTSTASLLCFAEVNRFSVLRSLTTWILSVLVVVLVIGLPVGVLLLLLR
ncbi:MAG TPA: YIP1 family protein [Candidatus Eisenbacteria bacterium]|nr:YIP1 family protein [Candidatus Eisenbacteria bacterium]